MNKPEQKKLGISPERLAELQQATFIASTGASMRLAGSRVTDKEVGQIVSAINRPSGQK